MLVLGNALLKATTTFLQVAEAGSVRVTKLMEVERYSHVMHISSTVKGKLLGGLDAWDALRAALPAGTISGAPKVFPRSPMPAKRSSAGTPSCPVYLLQ